VLRPYEGLDGWIPCVHPEGALYWHHPERVSLTESSQSNRLTLIIQKIYTSANLHQASLFQWVQHFTLQIDAVKKTLGDAIPPDIEYMVHIELEGFSLSEYECYYYMIDHVNRCIFWMNEFDATYMLSELDGVTSPMHIRYVIESHYWCVDLHMSW
jgi:hypothetical protein